MKVEVEFEDLETIVFATAAIKQIETALAARKQDPFVRPHLAYTNAHNNLTAAMNSARRAQADTLVAWDGELSNDEIKLLTRLTNYDLPTVEVTGDYRRKTSEIDTLSAKGCIRIGQRVEGSVWPGEPSAELRIVPSFSLQITRRGKEKLEQALLKKVEKTSLLDDSSTA